MDYRQELKKLKKHRKQFKPVIDRIMDLYDSGDPARFPFSIDAVPDILIVCELIDIGYLDPNALIVKKKFDDITHVVYNGKYPLTEKGEQFYHHG